MEEFRKKAKRTIKICWTVIIAAVVLWMVLLITVAAIDVPDTDIDSIGGLGGFIAVMAVNIAQYSAALKDDKKLKKLYIDETDERTRLIREKSDSLTFNLIIGILAASVFISSFFSRTVFYTIGAVLLVVALIKGGCQLYYNKKY